jgi:hypothetical protein
MPLQFWIDWVRAEPSLQPAEAWLKDCCDQISSHEINYLIASLKGDTSSLLHEWAHARYFQDQEYCLFMYDCLHLIHRQNIYSNLDSKLKSSIETELLLRKYKPHVFADEFQAYILESPIDFGKKFKDQLLPIHTKLRQLISLPRLYESISIIPKEPDHP